MKYYSNPNDLYKVAHYIPKVMLIRSISDCDPNSLLGVSTEHQTDESTSTRGMSGPDSASWARLDGLTVCFVWCTLLRQLIQTKINKRVYKGPSDSGVLLSDGPSNKLCSRTPSLKYRFKKALIRRTSCMRKKQINCRKEVMSGVQNISF